MDAIAAQGEPICDHFDWKLVMSTKFRSGCELQYWNETLRAGLLIESSARGKTYTDFVLKDYPHVHFKNEADLIEFVAERQRGGSAFGEIERLRAMLKSKGINPDAREEGEADGR